MKLFDILIIVLYLLATIIIGVFLNKRARKNMDSYFLGGKSIPWYLLGLSNASGMFDISGTMWLVYLFFVYGMKSIWIPWLWPVFNQIFLMVYLSIWLRRSNVLTGAEWIATRFGRGLGGKLSHFVVVAFALINVLGFLSYGFIGIGKFMAIFMPPEWGISDTTYGMIFTAIATTYVVLGGMYSIVLTDLLQFVIMTISSFIIAVIAMQLVDASTLQAFIPDGWLNPFFGWELGLNWEGVSGWATQTTAQLNQLITSDGYNLFGIFMMMMLFKGFLVASAGPAPSYDMQKVLSTRTPKEGALMSGFVSIALLPSRYLMIMGFTVLALTLLGPELNTATGITDFEKILPMAIKKFVPTGVVGLMIAGLLAAFMSTFASTVNAAPAYLVNDIYKRFINPNASNKTLIKYSYFVAILAVLLSTIIGLYINNINQVLQWIMSALYGGYVASNMLKWYWWRLNGKGYFWGMISGMLVSSIPIILEIIEPDRFPSTFALYFFPITFLISILVCIIVSLATPIDDEQILKDFYLKVRPWGFWKPIREKLKQEYPDILPNKDFAKDTFNMLIGIVWQTCLVFIPVYVVLKHQTGIITSSVIMVISALILKYTWYNKIKSYPDGISKEKKIA